MASSGGKERSNRAQNRRKPRRKDSSSLVVEQDIQSNANAVNEPDTHNSAEHLSDEKDLDLPALEQSVFSPKKCLQDYYLLGLTMQNPAIPPNDSIRVAPDESVDGICETDSLVAAGYSEEKLPISRPSPMDKYLSDNSENRYAVFILKSSDGVEWSQYTDCEGRSSR